MNSQKLKNKKVGARYLPTHPCASPGTRRAAFCHQMRAVIAGIPAPRGMQSAVGAGQMLLDGGRARAAARAPKRPRPPVV